MFFALHRLTHGWLPSVTLILLGLAGLTFAQQVQGPQQADMAKNVTRYGLSPDFWRSHALVLGTVSSDIEHRQGAEYFLRLKPSASASPHFPSGNIIRVKYTAAPNQQNASAGNFVNGLKEGDKVLVLLRPEFGGPSLPNCSGESFAFMPSGHSLYRVESADDQNVIDTTRIVKVCSIAELSERITAISSLLEDRSSEHVRSFFSIYLDSLVSKTETQLENARTILKRLEPENAG